MRKKKIIQMSSLFLVDQTSIIIILKNFFLERPYLDFYIVNQGETDFLELLNKYSGKLDRNHQDTQQMENLAFYNKKLKIYGYS